MTTTTRLPRTAASSLKPAAPNHTNWRNYAACRTEDPELFFPLGVTPLAQRQTSEAKQICGRCQVRSTCLDWSISTGQAIGVWGGLSEDERMELMSVQGDAAWAVCLDRQEFIEQRRAEGGTVRGIAQEIGVAYELFRKVIKYFDLERSTLAAVGGEGQ